MLLANHFRLFLRFYYWASVSRRILRHVAAWHPLRQN